jgi:hypothetical protein
MVVKWWSRCRKIAAMSPRSQKKLGDERYVRSLLRIAALPEEIGGVLDARTVPLRVCKWIAWAPGVDQVQAEGQRRRFEEAVQFQAKHARWPSDREITVLSGPPPRRVSAAERRKEQFDHFVQTLDEGITASTLPAAELAGLREAALESMKPMLGGHRAGPAAQESTAGPTTGATAPADPPLSPPVR